MFADRSYAKTCQERGETEDRIGQAAAVTADRHGAGVVDSDMMMTITGIGSDAADVRYSRKAT